MKNLFILLLLFVFISCQKKTIHPTKGEIIEAVYGLGRVESEDNFEARAAILSYVEEFYVTKGQDVKKGERLFKTDQNRITYAPFEGRITDILVSVHENLFPQTIVLSLVNLNKLYLSVSLEQQGAMRIKKGLKAEVSFEFFRNTKLKGVIETIYPRKDEFIAKVKVENLPSEVLPGMTADVAFEIDRKQEATLIPAKAINNGHLVFKRDGKKVKVPVEIGLVDLDQVEVLKPELNPDDEIILP